MSIVWQPHAIQDTQMAQFLHDVETRFNVRLNDYDALYAWSIEHKALFWQAVAQFFKFKFFTPATCILKYTSLLDAKWFIGATFNFAEQLLARRDNYQALISYNEQGHVSTLSFAELYQQVAHCLAGLKRAGVTKGTRVVGVLPNQATAIIAMLACASIGAIWSSCSPEFGLQTLIDRLIVIEPLVLFISDGYQYRGTLYDNRAKIEHLSGALPTLKHMIVCPELSLFESLESLKLTTNAYLWADFIDTSVTTCTFTPLAFDHPLYILFSSGTTGKPKCIVHGAGNTLIQHVKELGLHTDLRADETLFFYTTCGWMMWNWMVSALALGVRLILYDGSPAYPGITHLFDIVRDEQVSVFGTSAKFLSTLAKADVSLANTHHFPKLRTILTTGSPLLPTQFDFIMNNIKQTIQISSISGGTDIISCFVLGNPLKPVYHGEIQGAGLGMAVQIFNQDGKAVVDKDGELVCTEPFPSMPLYFWHDTHHRRYKAAYFTRFAHAWTQGDYARKTYQGGFIIHGRSDTTLNPGGVRIGTAELYRLLETLPEISESVVVGQQWADDVRIILFVKLSNNGVLDETLCQKIKYLLKSEASPRHVPAKILQVNDIPRTLNHKIVEQAVREVIHHQPITNVHALLNPEALSQFTARPELSE